MFADESMLNDVSKENLDKYLSELAKELKYDI